MHTNITNLIDTASDHTPGTLNIQVTIEINLFIIIRINWYKFRNIMTSRSSLNLKLKKLADIDNAINTLTKNIQDTLQTSSTISQAH